MDFKKKYFFITIHFAPNYDETFKCIENDLYQNVSTGEKFRKRLLYDFGWGQEDGFELLPALSFDELIKLVEHQLVPRKKKIWQKYSEKEIHDMNVHQSNLFGAVSVIMQDHIEEFIDFLSIKINTDYFMDIGLRKNYMWFSFSSQKTREAGYIPGGVLTHSYEDLLNRHAQWREISSQVISQVYC